jgi:hypothetical protein
MAAQQGILSPGTLLRPQATADFLAKSTPARIGLVLAILGFMLAMVPFIGSAFNANLVADATPDEGSIAANGIWTFGLATASFGMIKLGIALILFGVVRRIWIRVESVKAGLAKLVPAAENKNAIDSARITTPFGVANVTATAPKPLGIHRMAYKMWAPMAVMGIMILGIGLIFSIIAAVNAGDNDFVDFRTFAALGQGTEFLGEALLLSGIAFLLGSVMGSLRQGGGELQESLGVAVKTPAMPVTAKLFVALMMIGLMLGMLQFVLYWSSRPTTARPPSAHGSPGSVRYARLPWASSSRVSSSPSQRSAPRSCPSSSGACKSSFGTANSQDPPIGPEGHRGQQRPSGPGKERKHNGKRFSFKQTSPVRGLQRRGELQEPRTQPAAARGEEALGSHVRHGTDGIPHRRHPGHPARGRRRRR